MCPRCRGPGALEPVEWPGSGGTDVGSATRSVVHVADGARDALGVAVLSAVASTAGSLATLDGAADAFNRGFTCAAVIAAVVAAYALWRMPAQRVTGAVGHMHH